MKYLVSIGLETHVQLKTRTKMFCGCPLSAGSEPNTNVCPVCLGLPGALPRMNREAVRLTVVSGLMLGCRIPPRAEFDRKNYFYPDMSKNYQISEDAHPLCIGGGVEIRAGGAAGGRPKTVRLNHIHLEEDAAKINHYARHSGVDYNRCGTPLMEIVSEPDIASPDEALDYLQTLRRILVYAGVSDCNLEDGNMRADVNISLRPEGAEKLGTKVEIKNMNTFKGIHAALEFEIARQTAVLDGGGRVVQETRRWDGGLGETFSMRTKENAHDYRYFPEPDLLPVTLSEERVELWRKSLPELPEKKKARFRERFGLPEYDAGVLSAERALAEYFEATVAAGAKPKAAANWIMGDVLRLLGAAGKEAADVASLSTLPPASLASLLALVEARTVNGPTAKALLEELFEKGGDPAAIVEERGLAQVSDAGAVEDFARRAIEANPKPVAEYKAGKKASLQFLVGQVMKLSRGKADPRLAAEVLAKAIAETADA
ncbi:MAG: Asp-tRNA(Asn)/Glu-tRNA(Gln) amidotransferase subunit GatB [Kiritimatiellae bacterium]|nr:Asp-tRNA(Asn)/Glu-tRNA(Gln) amidotransferase subunit GatB [Kiritimatiellia bacterium]